MVLEIEDFIPHPSQYINSEHDSIFIKNKKNLPYLFQKDTLSTVNSTSESKATDCIKKAFLTGVIWGITFLLSGVTFLSKIYSIIVGKTDEQKHLEVVLKLLKQSGPQIAISYLLNLKLNESKYEKLSESSRIILNEFLNLPQTHMHLEAILKGANVKLQNDFGRLCNRWKNFPGVYERLSSHDSQDGKFYAFGNVLFWIDKDGDTRFQVEKNPFRGFFDKLYHIIDYLKYARDEKQQGISGSSIFTESNPIILLA